MSVVEIADVPRNYAPQKLLASIVIPGELIVYGFTVTSTNAAAQYVTMFDADAVPADGATPILFWPLAAHNGVGFSWLPAGRSFQAGLVLSNSSTDSTKTLGSVDCLFDVQYALLGS